MLATKEVYMRVPRTMLPYLHQLAREHQVTRSAVLRRALELYLSQHTDWVPSSEGELP